MTINIIHLCNKVGTGKIAVIFDAVDIVEMYPYARHSMYYKCIKLLFLLHNIKSHTILPQQKKPGASQRRASEKTVMKYRD